ncbi:hypothetical protein Tco_0402841, partial [Tanacetum coccineum]
MRRWVGSFTANGTKDDVHLHSRSIKATYSYSKLKDINQDSKKALNIKYPSNFLKIDMKIKDENNIIDGED